MLQSMSEGIEDELHIAWDFNTILDRALVEELLDRFIEGKTSSCLLEVLQAYFNDQDRR